MPSFFAFPANMPTANPPTPPFSPQCSTSTPNHASGSRDSAPIHAPSPTNSPPTKGSQQLGSFKAHRNTLPVDAENHHHVEYEAGLIKSAKAPPSTLGPWPTSAPGGRSVLRNGRQSQSLRANRRREMQVFSPPSMLRAASALELSPASAAAATRTANPVYSRHAWGQYTSRAGLGSIRPGESFANSRIRSSVPRSNGLSPTTGAIYAVQLPLTIEGLGIQVAGGADTALGALFVAAILEDSAAAASQQIHVGDRFLAVQGQETLELSRDQLRQYIRQLAATGTQFLTFLMMHIGAEQWRNLQEEAGLSQSLDPGPIAAHDASNPGPSRRIFSVPEISEPPWPDQAEMEEYEVALEADDHMARNAVSEVRAPNRQSWRGNSRFDGDRELWLARLTLEQARADWQALHVAESQALERLVQPDLWHREFPPYGGGLSYAAEPLPRWSHYGVLRRPWHSHSSATVFY